LITIEINIKEDCDLEYVQARIALLGEYLNTKIPEILGEIGLSIEEDSKSDAPVKTGKLRASISSSVQDNQVTITCDVPYASIQEHKKHFMEDAAKAHKQELIDKIIEVIEDYFKELV